MGPREIRPSLRSASAGVRGRSNCSRDDTRPNSSIRPAGSSITRAESRPARSARERPLPKDGASKPTASAVALGASTQCGDDGVLREHLREGEVAPHEVPVGGLWRRLLEVKERLFRGELGAESRRSFSILYRPLHTERQGAICGTRVMEHRKPLQR